MKTFLKRLFSTVILLGLLGGAIFLKEPYNRILFSVLLFCGAFLTPWEMTGMMKTAGLSTYRGIVSCICSILPIGILNLLSSCSREMFLSHTAVFGLFFFLCMLIPWIFLLTTENRKEEFQKILYSEGCILMFLPAFLIIALIYRLYGPMVFLFFILMTKIGDIGAYVTGSLSNYFTRGGNHKIFPLISPKKSYEGCIGGLFFSILFSMLLYPLLMKFFPLSPVWTGILGAVLYVGGASGDLAESVIKRTCGVKDSGHTLPGIGGIFDLADSLVFNSIVFAGFIVLYLVLN